MTTKITRHSAVASLEMMADGVLVVRLSGPLTGEALGYFKAQIVALHGPDIRAFVADYTRATIALTGAELDAVLDGEDRGAAPMMPAALVVTPEVAPVFEGHAARMALLGVRRRVFVESEQAIAWVRSRVSR